MRPRTVVIAAIAALLPAAARAQVVSITAARDTTIFLEASQAGT